MQRRASASALSVMGMRPVSLCVVTNYQFVDMFAGGMPAHAAATLRLAGSRSQVKEGGAGGKGRLGTM